MTSNPDTPQGGTPDTFGLAVRSPEKPAVFSPATAPTPQDPEDGPYTGFDLWLHRVTVLLFVFVCAVAGVLLMILPWRPEWTDNRLLMAYPGLRTFITSGFVRGICSGLGLLDIWVGFWEAIHYHEGRPH